MNEKQIVKICMVLCVLMFFGGYYPCAGEQERTTGISCFYEELTAAEFAQAVERSAATCLIPLGVMEKHGEHLPLGTDLIACRETARLAAEKEYTIIFPPYYFSQIFEARHQPGTLAYSQKLIFALLEETCAELARNGIKKIILFNGHGGNESFLPYFCQSQLASRRDYAVYLFTPAASPEQDPEIQKLFKTVLDMHGGERETSVMLAVAPKLVRLDLIQSGSGWDQQRLGNLKQSYTGIWWYASFPDHYAGDARPANAELGRLLLQKEAAQLADMIHEVKQDRTSINLQNKFYDASEKPLREKK